MQQKNLRNWLFWWITTPIFIFMVCGFLMSNFLIKKSIDSWFRPSVRKAIVESNEVALAYKKEKEESLKNILSVLSFSINKIFRSEYTVLLFKMKLQKFMEEFVNACELNEMAIYNKKAELIAKCIVDDDESKINIFPAWLFKFFEDKPQIISVGDSLYGIIKLEHEQGLFLIIRRHVDPKVKKRIFDTENAAKEYEKNLVNHSTTMRRFLLLFCFMILILTLSIFFLAIKLAKRIIVPITNLVGCAKKVEKGEVDIDFNLKYGIYELKLLGSIITKMVKRLSDQKRKLQENYHELTLNKELLETILKGVSSGVVFLNFDHHVAFFNEKANELIPEIYKGFDFYSLVDFKNETSIKLALHDKILFLHRIKTADGIVITFDDMSYLIAAEKQKAFEDIVRKIAHEIKNPLTPIRLSAEAISNSEDEKIKTYSSIMIRNIDQIYNLIASFSTLATMPKIYREEKNFTKFIKTILQEFSLTFKSIKFSASLTDVNLKFDEKVLYQAISNVIYNAIDALKEKDNPEIKIILKENEKSVVLSVQDNGMGWPPGVEPETWLMPYKTNKKSKGTGLGLAVAKKILEEHDGVLNLKRAKVGAIVEFCFKKMS